MSNKTKKTVIFQADVILDDALKRKAVDMGVSKSFLLRCILTDWLYADDRQQAITIADKKGAFHD